MKNLWGKFITGIFVLYFIGAFVVFTPYYNWQYAKTHGFINWLVFGEIKATIVAMAWPYIVFQESYGSISHLNKAIDYLSKSTEIINKSAHYQSIAPADERKEVIGCYKKALTEAKKVDIESTNQTYPGFGDHFRSEFIKGLELFIQSVETGDEMTFDASMALLSKWKNWYQANMEGFRGR